MTNIALVGGTLPNTAEFELSLRIASAGRNIGADVRCCATSEDVLDFAPDFVLAMHMNFPKLTKYPTYGCMWNPPPFFADNGALVRNILSYDGYLCASSEVKQYVSDLTYDTVKPYFVGEFYPSSGNAILEERDYSNAKLAYIGTNWDGPRFSSLMENLARFPFINFFGPKGRWDHVGGAYGGALPFDGVSVMRQLHASGIALCLHRPEHIWYNVPNMRIFEAAASGAIIITEEIPFVRENFGDSVFYIGDDYPPEIAAQRISDVVEDIRRNPTLAAAKAKRANEIFRSKFSLETLLASIISQTQSHRRSFIAHKMDISIEPTLDCIVRSGFRAPHLLERALSSIVDQNGTNIRVLLVNNGDCQYVSDIAKRYRDQINIKELKFNGPHLRSTSLWLGLAEVTAPFFCILDDDDVMYPGHTALHISILQKNTDSIVAYGGAVRTLEGVDATEEADFLEVKTLEYMEPFRKELLESGQNFMTSNSFVARSELLDNDILRDPLLAANEDLWLLINLSRKGDFINSWSVTTEFFWRKSMSDNVSFRSDALNYSLSRIKTRLQLRSWSRNDVSISDIYRGNWWGNSSSPRTDILLVDTCEVAGYADGYVDSISVVDGVVTVSGWADFYRPKESRTLIFSGILAGTAISTKTISRLDVVQARNNWGLYYSGYEVVFKIDRLSSNFKTLGVMIYGANGEALQLQNTERSRDILISVH